MSLGLHVILYQRQYAKMTTQQMLPS